MTATFRVRTELRSGGTRNAYLQTQAGAAQRLLAELRSPAAFAVELYDRRRANRQGGCVGRLGGLTTARSAVIAIAQALNSQAVADLYHVPATEWQTDTWVVDQVLSCWPAIRQYMRRKWHLAQAPEAGDLAAVLGLTRERVLHSITRPYGRKRLVLHEMAADRLLVLPQPGYGITE